MCSEWMSNDICSKIKNKIKTLSTGVSIPGHKEPDSNSRDGGPGPSQALEPGLVLGLF